MCLGYYLNNFTSRSSDILSGVARWWIWSQYLLSQPTMLDNFFA